MKYTIEATIPVVQYGNIKPLIEVESPEDEASAVETIKRLWDRFGESPIKDKSSGGKKIVSFTDEIIYFNADTHTYTDQSGNVLISGSKYAEKVSPKFDLDMLAPKTATSWGVSEADLRDIWKMNADTSTSWGTAIHNALEIYHKYQSVGAMIQEKKQMDVNYVLPKNKFIRGLVESFVEKFGANAGSEVVISDVANGMVGTVDRLSESAGVYRIGDYKTNAEMDSKKKLKYQHQLSYYAHILINKGYSVSGLDLYYLDEDFNWVHEEMDVLPLET
jgi:hypothetical protein